MNLVLLKVTTTGADGAAVGSVETGVPVYGEIKAVVLDYHASAPNTTDVELYMTTTPSYLILNCDNKNTDIALHPRKQSCNNAGTLLTLDGTREKTESYAVAGQLTLAVAECDALTDAVTAWIFYE